MSRMDVTKILIIAIFYFLSLSIDGRPASIGVIDNFDQDQDLDVETIYERLKLGDENAWRQYGAEVVEVVYRMVDQNLARDPFDALLMLFYPNLTPNERKETLEKFEPMLKKLMEQQSTDDGVSTKEELTLYKRSGEDESNEKLRDALRQLKMEPDEATIDFNGDQQKSIDKSIVDQKIDNRSSDREKERRQIEGQKEMPIYLGTHESPEGISWRV